MKKSNKISIAILVAVVAGILLSVPLSFAFDKQSFAGTEVTSASVVNNSSVSVAGDDYIFVVLEDEAVPLAAAPVSSGINNKAVVAVVVMLAGILGISYIYWYIMTQMHIKSYAYVLTNSEYKRIVPKNSFIHPIDFANAEKEVLFRAATK